MPKSLSPLQHVALSSLPTPSATYRGMMARVEGASGVKDGLYLCQKTAAGAYAWMDVNDWASLSGKPSVFPPDIGSGPSQAVAGNDTRLTNARTPTAHRATHASGGADALSASDVGAAPSSHVGSGGSAHANATQSVAGFQSEADKAKLDGLNSNEVFAIQADTAQTIPTGGSAYKLALVSDAANIVDVGSADYATEEWIAPRAGTFWVGAMLQAPQAVDGAQLILDVYKNGAYLRRLTGVHTSSTRHAIAANAVPVKALANDRFSVWATYNGGSGVASLAVNNNSYFYGGS